MSRRVPANRIAVSPEPPEKPKTPKQEVLWTMRYDLFVLHTQNRKINPSLVRQKVRMFQETGGWCPAMPLVCRKNGGGKLDVIDGQHRLEAARKLELPIPYAITKEELDPQQINSNQKVWSVADHVDSFAAAGNSHYDELRSFAAEYQMPLCVAAQLLSGQSMQGRNGGDAVRAGLFKVSQREYARAVGAIVRELKPILRSVTTHLAVACLSRFCAMPEFSASQLVCQCRKYPAMLFNCATIEQYAAMFEEVYNHRMKLKKLPLKFMASQSAKSYLSGLPEKKRLE